MEKKNNKHVFPIIWEVRVYENPVAWENSCSASICHGAFKLEEKSKVTVKTTTLIYGSSEVLKLIKR